MSGQLVGEVIAASPRLRADGLSRNGFLALIAIAEKCHHVTRQGSVRWDHLCDGLYGVSKRTAARAVHELKEAKLIEVVKPGWANQHHEAQAPIYELRIAPPMASSTRGIAPPMASSTELDSDKTGLDDDKLGLDDDKHLPPTCGVPTLDGSIDGSLDGGARAGEPTAQPDGRPPDWPTPPNPCRKHPHGYDHDENCRACAALRTWDENAPQRQQQNYTAAWIEYNTLRDLAAAGALGDWQPVRPPLYPSDFDPDTPWHQPTTKTSPEEAPPCP